MRNRYIISEIGKLPCFYGFNDNYIKNTLNLNLNPINGYYSKSSQLGLITLLKNEYFYDTEEFLIKYNGFINTKGVCQQGEIYNSEFQEENVNNLFKRFGTKPLFIGDMINKDVVTYACNEYDQYLNNFISYYSIGTIAELVKGFRSFHENNNEFFKEIINALESSSSALDTLKETASMVISGGSGSPAVGVINPIFVSSITQGQAGLNQAITLLKNKEY